MFRRAERLIGTNSASDFENATAEYEIAQADVAAAEAKVEQSKVLAEQAQINLGYTTIRSPVDGVVIDRRVNVGQTVVAGLNAPSLFLMAKDLSRMLVWAAVNEADIGDVHLGQKVTFKVDAYRERTFSGKVAQIRLNASMVQNVVTYGVVVEVDNLDGTLLPYMTAKLQFEIARRSNALLVPNQALRWQPAWDEVSPTVRAGLESQIAEKTLSSQEKDAESAEVEAKVDLASPVVWVLADDGFVRPVKVRVGLSDGLSTEIAEGELEAGMHVVLKVVRAARPDFVSSFISKVTNTKK
jgi:HlyD family secretion protein